MQNSSDANTTFLIDIAKDSAYATSYTGSSGSPLSIFAWGAQLSQHKFVPVGNPYIKTTTAAVYGARLDHEAGYFLSVNQAQNLVPYSEDFSNRDQYVGCLLYTSPSPRDGLLSRMPSSA